MSKAKVPRRSLWYVTHHLMVMHPHTKYHWPISKDKNVMSRTRKYYLKNNYLTLRSKVKVPHRSLRYATHHLMVMHTHTKYSWPIWKDKKVMVRTSFTEKKQKSGSGRKNQIKTICSFRSKGRHNKLQYRQDQLLHFEIHKNCLTWPSKVTVKYDHIRQVVP